MIAALEGQNKVPTSGRGWQERESGRREGERRGAGGMAGGRQNVGVSGAGSSSTVRKGERSTEANHTVPQRRSVFVFILETTEAAGEKGRWQGLSLFMFCVGCSVEPVLSGNGGHPVAAAVVQKG